jgi:hypothetical protein
MPSSTSSPCRAISGQDNEPHISGWAPTMPSPRGYCAQALGSSASPKVVWMWQSPSLERQAQLPLASSRIEASLPSRLTAFANARFPEAVSSMRAFSRS